MKPLSDYATRILMILLVIMLVPVLACAETTDIAAASTEHYERLERLKTTGLAKEIDLMNDFLSPELREAISNAVVCLPSFSTDGNNGYTAISYEVVSMDQDSAKTTVALNLFSMSYSQEHEHLYCIGYEAAPWRLIFEINSNTGDLNLSAAQTPWDTVEGSDFSYDDAIDMYWAGNTNSYPGIAINAWLEIDVRMRNSTKEQDDSDVLIIRQNALPDNLP